MLGVAGTGMGSFAGLLQAAGYEVTGSDENVYPPMSDMLGAWGIRALTPSAREPRRRPRPDLVIVGNVIRRVNPEATAMRERGLPHMSFPAALGDLFLATRHSVVVAGTHGKTTTSALPPARLVAAGRDPSSWWAASPANYETNFRLGKGAALRGRGRRVRHRLLRQGAQVPALPAAHAHPHQRGVDHADIYRDLGALQVELREAAGAGALQTASPVCVGLCQRGEARAAGLRAAGVWRVETYSASVAADWTAAGLRLGADGAHFQVIHRGSVKRNDKLSFGPNTSSMRAVMDPVCVDSG